LKLSYEKQKNLSYNIIVKEIKLSFKEFAMIIVKKEMGKRLILDLRLTSAEQGNLLKSDELFCQHWESLFNLRE